jgi:hypothetical protein
MAAINFPNLGNKNRPVNAKRCPKPEYPSAFPGNRLSGANRPPASQTAFAEAVIFSVSSFPLQPHTQALK